MKNYKITMTFIALIKSTLAFFRHLLCKVYHSMGKDKMTIFIAT